MRRISATGSTAGFTLIELLTVLTLLVMAAAMIPIALSRSLPRAHLASAQNTWTGASRRAQELSTLRGMPIALVLKDHRLILKPAAAASGQTEFSLPTGVSLSIADFEGVPRDELRFFPDGSTDGRIVSLKAGKLERQLTISALTGRLWVSQE